MPTKLVGNQPGSKPISFIVTGLGGAGGEDGVSLPGLPSWSGISNGEVTSGVRSERRGQDADFLGGKGCIVIWLNIQLGL